MADDAWYLGIDWGGEEHRCCLVDASGRVCEERSVAHQASEVHAAIGWVRARTGVTAAEIAVGLATPHGPLVDTLLEDGFVVDAIHPKQLDRCRDRFSARGAKDDRRDAHVAADALRTDPRAFRVVRPDEPRVIELRERGHIVEDTRGEERRLANRLREQLYRVPAPWRTLSPGADDAWGWALLADTPQPSAWPHRSRRRIAAVLRTHRITRFTAADVVDAVRIPALTVAPGVTDAVALRVASLVPPLILIHRQRREAERQLERRLQQLADGDDADRAPHEHRDVEILRSLPGVGSMVTATMLAEAPRVVADRDDGTLRTDGGVAPVTKQRGKRTAVSMRYACTPRLRNALHHWAQVSLQHDAAARAYYDRRRRRGHGHARARRSVADRWLRIFIAMLKTRTLYDATRFTSHSVQTC